MGVLMILLTIGGVLMAAIFFIFGVWKKLVWLRKFVLGAVAVWFAIYAAMLIGFSLASEEKNLGLNEPKEFCGFYLDCHLHTAVTDVRKAKTLGDKTAKGEFYIVKTKIFSDAKRATLNFPEPKIRVLDADGKYYFTESDTGVFKRPLEAGAVFESEIVFDLPADVKNPLLEFILDDAERVIEFVLIGDEDSIFHKKTRFILEQNPFTASF